jgi:hypothetical protein
MAAFVHNERQVGRPENSQRVYEPKITEFELFCDHVYPHCQFRYNMDGEKFYKFLFWTGHHCALLFWIVKVLKVLAFPFHMVGACLCRWDDLTSLKLAPAQ